MIDVFIPKKINSYYIRKKRILGISIADSHIRATQILLNGYIKIIEKFIEQPLDLSVESRTAYRMREVIQLILNQADSCDEIKVSLSGVLAFFKELQFPFFEHEKIARVLPFELERYLPYAIDSAIFDFIITRNNAEIAHTAVMAAAVQKQHIAEYLSYFEGLQTVDVISLDVFDLYGFYSLISKYSEPTGTYVLVDIELYIVRLLYIVDKQLRFVRILPHGLVYYAKKVSQSVDVSSKELVEYLIRFGLTNQEDELLPQHAKECVMALWRDIIFTVDAFGMQIVPQRSPDSLLIFGVGVTIPGLLDFIQKQTTMKIELFEANAIAEHTTIQLKEGQRLTQQFIMSLAVALPNTVTDQVNFRQGEFKIFQTKPIIQSTLVTAFLMIMILGGFLFYSWLYVRGMHKKVRQLETEVVSYLVDEGLSGEGALAEVLKEAQEKVEREEAVWFAFSRQTGFSFVKNLQDIHEAIDRKGLDLDLKKMVMTENSITLEGTVKGYEELKTLERELRESNLFKFVPTLQDIKFSNVTLLLKKNNEELQ